MKALKCALAAAAAGLAAATGGAAADDLNVVVTIKPIHSLVTRLLEGIATPTLLLEGGASPHSFALRPSGVRAINNADVFIRVGESLEPFTAKVVKTLPRGVLLVTLEEETPGLKRLDRRAGGTFEPHPHASPELAALADMAHEEETGRRGKDGHIWLDPDNAKAIASHLATVLSARAPEHRAKLQENAASLNARIDALSADLERETAPLKGKPFVVFHDAYQYFESRFGLDALGSITVSPEMHPSAKRIGELRAKIKALKAACVFAEPMFQPRLVAAVTEGTDARTGTLDPDGTTLAPGADLYFELMRNLAAALKSCLI